jgi:hypothetical protein
MQALWISREACREFALRYSWENSAHQFISHARKVAIAAVGKNPIAAPLQAGVHSEPQSLVPESDRSTTGMTHEHSV